MQSIFSSALSTAVAKHIDLSVTRRETLSWLTLLIMQHGTICLWRLAADVCFRQKRTLAVPSPNPLRGQGGGRWVYSEG